MDFKIVEQYFLEELQKLGNSMQVSQARIGRRPITADNLVKKHNEGTLFKDQPKVKDISNE
jgi:hypothetical protein